MGAKLLSFAWKIILVADLGVLLYGIMALLNPYIFVESYQTYTGQTWSALYSTSPKTAEYILLLARLVGAFNIAFGFVACAIVLTGFRKGQRWSWYTLLVGNTLGYFSPIINDQITGTIGFFEQLEIFLIVLVYLALGVSAKHVLLKKALAKTT